MKRGRTRATTTAHRSLGRTWTPGGCDQRYHCCERYGDCVEGQDGCVLYGMRQDEAEAYAKQLEQQSEET